MQTHNQLNIEMLKYDIMGFNDYWFSAHLHESQIVLTRILLPLPHLDLSQLVLQLQEPLGDRGLLHQQQLEQAVQVGNLGANLFSRCVFTILGPEDMETISL